MEPEEGIYKNLGLSAMRLIFFLHPPAFGSIEVSPSPEKKTPGLAQTQAKNQFIKSKSQPTNHTFPSQNQKPFNQSPSKMSGGPFVGNLVISQPEVKGGNQTNEPFIEPYLRKHSAWYREHGTHDHKKEYDGRRPSSVGSEGVEDAQGQRRSSVNEEAAVEAARRVSKDNLAEEMKHLKEREGRKSSIVDGIKYGHWGKN